MVDLSTTSRLAAAIVPNSENSVCFIGIHPVISSSPAWFLLLLLLFLHPAGARQLYHHRGQQRNPPPRGFHPAGAHPRWQSRLRSSSSSIQPTGNWSIWDKNFVEEAARYTPHLWLTRMWRFLVSIEAIQVKSIMAYLSRSYFIAETD